MCKRRSCPVDYKKTSDSQPAATEIRRSVSPGRSAIGAGKDDRPLRRSDS
ncbi:MAG: hypothetical protein ACWGKN_14745 [Desulfoprunum sp.]